MVGGAISGNWVTGSANSPIRPSNTIKIDITVESTGRLINVSSFISCCQTIIKNTVMIDFSQLLLGSLRLIGFAYGFGRDGYAFAYDCSYAFHRNAVAGLKT